MFGLNLFTAERFASTTTVLWLRYISLAITVIGLYVVYYARQQTPPSRVILVVGVIIALIGLLSLLAYLLYGSQIATYNDKQCSFCPSTPVRVALNNGTRGTLPAPAPLPDVNPFLHTAIYYVTVDELYPQKSTKQTNTIIRRKDLYNIIVDNATGEIGLQLLPSATEDDKVSYFGKLPQQSFSQIAVAHNEKEISVFVNGMLRGAVVRKNLPPTASVGSQYTFNHEGIIQSGILYQLQIYEGVLSEEHLMSANERMTIQYNNDCVFQNTRYPTENGYVRMTITEKILGWIRLLSSTFGYNQGVKLADSQTSIIEHTNTM